MSCKIIECDQELQYMVLESEFIKEHLMEITYQTDIIAAVLKERLASVDTNVTWLYKKYNVFAYASGSPAYFVIYKDLMQCLSIYANEFNLPTFNLWMRNWLNYHSDVEVLQLHNHDVMAHGYVSIQPQMTETVFVDNNQTSLYTIKNKPGLIYLGPGRRQHFVKNIDRYVEKRITIGIDLETNLNPGVNLGCLPIIL